ncbi:MAG TPA: hypothetical protein PK967_05470 [Candidatus Hydrogenedentes bacterium]|nr:hypothetical protein [Candidatus Hydrogenedentota bacterium]HPC18112.1 hypothetical protein [Candidatus Hydrogenedentota bacterium]
MIPLGLPHPIGAERVANRIRRPRLRNSFGLLAPEVHVAVPGCPATRILPFLERLWMPAYAICLRTLSQKGSNAVWASVEAISGAFSLLDCAEDLAPVACDENCFPPVMEEARAVELARKGYLQYTLQQRGQANKPVVETIEAVLLYHFAVWVYYCRRRGKIDISVFDGYTGKSAGAKMRIAVLDAFIAARKKRLMDSGKYTP